MSLKDPDALRARFDALTALLQEDHWWAPLPFRVHHLPWEAQHPELSCWLRGLTLEQVRALEEDPLALPAPAAFEDLARRTLQLSTLGPVQAPALGLTQTRDVRWRVPGRKWTQVRALAQALLGADMLRPQTTWVDWCAGKGHLGRSLAWMTQGQALLLERDTRRRPPALKLANRLRAQVDFVCTDVLCDPVLEHLAPEHGAVALHACGALGNALLRAGALVGVRSMAVVPCCHHFLGLESDFVPMSQAGRATGLSLSARQLRLSIADEAVAPGRELRLRDREQAWRQAVDLLVRQATGRQEYTTLGVFPKEDLKLPFEAFCREMAASRGLALPAHFDAVAAEAAGWERARVARGLGAVRSLFRRPLELWLDLDRALYLLEQGRPVEVGTFCARSVTPRNIVLLSGLS